ncbi:MAG TPA: AgmX/PglI C-terminal domain-containing protein [Burkholderiaceae bacterium]|nr:AgmX/PglI C-terminal domain-containing protein [Burkholderiaceae bacterium]
MVLPWTGSSADEKRFRRILGQVMLLCLLLALAIRLLPVPKVDREQAEELSPRLAKMLLEHQPPPPAPVPVAKPQPVPQPPTKSVLPQRHTARPEPEKIPVPEARQPVPDKPPGEVLEAARKKAAGVGLLAMKDELQELHGAPLAMQLKNNIKQGPGVGTGVGAGVGSGKGLGIPTRSMITSNATGGSGGINTAGYSRDTGGGGLAGRATTLVQGVAGGGGGGGPGGGGAGGSLQRGGDGKASRSIEEIKLVFERNKGAIYTIYNRALREDPTLQGKVVVELKIAPSGQVLDCKIVSSELKDTDLERKLLARIRQFDFGAKDVAQMVVTWPVDFLPS